MEGNFLVNGQGRRLYHNRFMFYDKWSIDVIVIQVHSNIGIQVSVLDSAWNSLFSFFIIAAAGACVSYSSWYLKDILSW